jgi:predicted DNA-binding protein
MMVVSGIGLFGKVFRGPHVTKKPRKPPSRGLDKVVLRLPPGMRDRLRELATASGRSANAVIVDLVEKAMADSADQKNLQDRVEDLEERMASMEHEFAHTHDDPNPD